MAEHRLPLSDNQLVNVTKVTVTCMGRVFVNFERRGSPCQTFYAAGNFLTAAEYASKHFPGEVYEVGTDSACDHGTNCVIQ